MKLFGVILTYNCETLVEKTIKDIPFNKFDKIICSDDGSTDKTEIVVKKNNIEFFKNTHGGYGENLLNGLKIAFEMGATHVIEIHGDGQYQIDKVEDIIVAFKREADLILGNRFFRITEPLVHGMPFHIYIGNLFFSFIARIGLGLPIKDLFPGLRAYNLNFFNIIKNFKLSKGYQFSFEIIAISKFYNLNIKSVDCICNYKEGRKTAPLFYVFKCFINIITTIIAYRLAKKKLLFGLFKKN